MSEKTHDKAYKRILSKKQNFLNFLHNFVKEEWINQIDEEELFLIDKEFIPKDYQEKEADVVYQGKINGEDVILYVLLEFQSSVDQTMIFRILEYMMAILQRTFRETDANLKKRKNFRLPPVIPIVLYTGKKKWSAVKSFKEYQNSYELFGNRLINFEYSLIDVCRIDESKLLEIDSLLSVVFGIERDDASDKFLKQIIKFSKNIRKLSQEDRIELFNWIGYAIKSKVSSKKEIELAKEFLLKGEVESMSYTIERVLDREVKKSKREGIIEGIMEGKRETARKLIENGIEIPIIVKATGLTEAEIEELKI